MNVRSGRSGRAVRSATGVSGRSTVQDVLRDAGESILGAAERWRDPRERLLRKRRRARRRATRYGIVSGASATGTAGLAILAAPDWSMFLTGAGAVVFAVPAVLALGTFRRLDSLALPLGLPVRRPLPPLSSAARQPMERLVLSERALHRVLGVLARSGAITPEDVEDTYGTARTAATALQAVAVDIAAMEDAAHSSRAAAAPLGRAIVTAVQQLEGGVGQYEGLVAAAADITVSGSVTGIDGLAFERAELLSATERLSGLATALGEIDDIVRRYR